MPLYFSPLLLLIQIQTFPSSTSANLDLLILPNCFSRKRSLQSSPTFSSFVPHSFFTFPFLHTATTSTSIKKLPLSLTQSTSSGCVKSSMKQGVAVRTDNIFISSIKHGNAWQRSHSLIHYCLNSEN